MLWDNVCAELLHRDLETPGNNIYYYAIGYSCSLAPLLLIVLNNTIQGSEDYQGKTDHIPKYTIKLIIVHPGVTI